MTEDSGNKNPWRWALFYFDPDDPRLLVPKRIPAFGFTLNFANKISWVILTAIIALIIWGVFTGHAGVHMP